MLMWRYKVIVGVMLFCLSSCPENIALAEETPESFTENSFVGGITEPSDPDYDSELTNIVAGTVVKSDGTEKTTSDGKLKLDNSLTPAVPNVKYYAGKYSFSGNADDGKAYLKGITQSFSTAAGGISDGNSNSADNNFINVSNSTLSVVYGGYAKSSGQACGNRIVMTNTDAGNVIGGYNPSYSSSVFETSNNKVGITNGNVTVIQGGYSQKGNTNNNIIKN